MTSTDTISDVEPHSEQAPRPNADAIASWVEATGGDEYAALLCATAELATQHAADLRDRVQRGELTRAAVVGPKHVADQARDDVAQYFGETLADQQPAVRRAAGFRS